MEKKNALLKTLPKIDDSIAMLRHEITEDVPSSLIRKIVRKSVEQQRCSILANADGYRSLSQSEWKELFLRELAEERKTNLRRVINGTGIVIHTNLGRSLLPPEAMEQLVQCSRHYSNLEFDLKSGKRGSRYSLVEELLCDITGAEAALVVNNNAAAVFLVIETLACNREAIVSRGELVEIGGSFRIPDVMAKSGATLVEVGATNRTHYYDYENALTENTSLLLKVHTSNFRMLGFTKEVSSQELVTLARQHNIAVMEDLGSGCLVDLSPYGLPQERTVQEVVATGIDVVTFSGDKLLGGPQAGVIVGRRKAIDRIKKNPLNRALRIDKFTLASLESVLRMYYDIDQALEKVPTLAMLVEKPADIKKRAQRILRKIKKASLVNCNISLAPTISQTGGGAIPEYGLDSWAVQMTPIGVSVNRLERDMRTRDLPLIGRIENEHFIIDCRTVLENDVNEIATAVIEYFRP